MTTHRCTSVATLAVALAVGTAWNVAPAAVEAQDPSAAIDVTTAVVGTGVEDREPVGTGTAFPASVGTVYFYTAFEGDFDERRIEHVWMRNGEEVGRVPLTIPGPRWRTWSRKTVPADWTGEWEARVVDADGSVLATAAFQVGGSPMGAG
jgi:hypothetical protein